MVITRIIYALGELLCIIIWRQVHAVLPNLDEKLPKNVAVFTLSVRVATVPKSCLKRFV